MHSPGEGQESGFPRSTKITWMPNQSKVGKMDGKTAQFFKLFRGEYKQTNEIPESCLRNISWTICTGKKCDVVKAEGLRETTMDWWFACQLTFKIMDSFSVFEVMMKVTKFYVSMAIKDVFLNHSTYFPMDIPGF